MSPQARAYNDGAIGARSDVATQQGLAPALEWVDSTGKLRTTRFDGFDEFTGELIDRKSGLVFTSKAATQALNQSAALAQQGLTGVWEVPTQYLANRATQRLASLGINNITVRVVPK